MKSCILLLQKKKKEPLYFEMHFRNNVLAPKIFSNIYFIIILPYLLPTELLVSAEEIS